MLLRGPLYSKSFEEKLVLLDQASDALEAYVSSLRDKVITSTKTGVDNLGVAIDNMSGSQEQMQVQMVQLCRAQQASKDAIEKMKKVFADTNSTAKWMSQKEKDIGRLRKQIQELERAANALTLDDMLEILDVSREHPLFDSRKILRSAPEVFQSELALSITTDDAFREWQAADTSAELFIKTQLSSMSSRHVSAVSLVSSNLV